VIKVELPKEQWWVLIRAAVQDGHVMLDQGERELAEELAGVIINVTSQVLTENMLDQIEGELNGDQ
jgi:hypothetical protein